MKNKNLNGLNEDLKRGEEYNRKHGGVSDELKKIMRRPENVHQYSVSMNYPNMLKCPVCGNDMFEFQKQCGECFLKSKI